MEVMWRLASEPQGSELEVRAEFGSSGLCRTFKKWAVDESSSEVWVQAIVTQSSTEECTDDLVMERRTIRLEEPLGTRRLTGCDSNNVDASCDMIAPDETAEAAEPSERS